MQFGGSPVIVQHNASSSSAVCHCINETVPEEVENRATTGYFNDKTSRNRYLEGKIHDTDKLAVLRTSGAPGQQRGVPNQQSPATPASAKCV
jgi:hypothetical protein